MAHVMHKEFGNDAYMKKEYQEAIGHYTLAIGTARADMFDSQSETSIRSKLASYYSNRAAAHTMVKQYDEALTDCDAAIKVDPTFSKAYLRKAKLQFSIGLFDEALATYQDATEHNPIDERIKAEQKDGYSVKRKVDKLEQMVGKIRSGDMPSEIVSAMEEALKDIETITLYCTNWSQLSLMQAELLNTLGKVDEAYELTNKLMVKGLEQDSSLLILRAKMFVSRGNMDDATKHLRKTLAGDPDNRRAVALLKTLRAVVKKKEEADAAYKSRNYHEAVGLYSEAMVLCPKDSTVYMARLYFNRASTQAALGRHEKSIADCTDAVKRDKDYVKAYMRRAASILLVDGGDRRAHCEYAVRDYETALELTTNPGQSRDIGKKLRAATVELRKAKRKDLYKILGVSSHSSMADIKKAYRKQALIWHPDRHNNSTKDEKEKAETRFRDINLAYEVLSDPIRKSSYDDGYADQDCCDDPATETGEAGVYGPAAGGRGSGIDPNVLFEMYMNQRSSDS